MIEKTLAKRYAFALLKVTNAEGSTEEAETSLEALRQAYASEKDFRAFLSQPMIPRKAKKTLFNKIFEGKARPSLTDFLALLVDKNRLGLLPDIADMFGRLADESRGILRVTVKSWHPLSDAQRGRLQSKLEATSGRKVVLNAQVDPASKGGILVLFGDTVIDGTVAHRLKEIGEKFRELQKR